MKLNRKQLIVYNWFVSAMPKDVRTVFLTGAAGTGKSFLISKIAQNFKGSVLLTATTNKAKANLKEATGKETYTTHSALGFVMVRNGTQEYLSDINEARQADLLIVDEVSMLPNQVYQKILKTPYKYILFVGDECQLPAVGVKAKIQTDRSINLDQQMRQDDTDVKLKRYMEKLRNSVKTKKLPEFKQDLPDNITMYEDHKEFCKAYKACEASKRILAYSNRVIDSYNNNITGRQRYKQGDLLVLDKPLGRAKNGDVVEVVTAGEYEDRFVVRVSFDGNQYGFYVMKSKTLEEKFLNKALENGQEYYWNTVDSIYHPKHIYASTIHKAQGQTIDEVFIDARDIAAQLDRKPTKYNRYNGPISNEEFLKLFYVAVSRMRVKAHIFIGEKRDYKSLKGEK